MHGDHNQFMHPIINFNTLFISPDNPFNFSIKVSLFPTIVGKVSLLSTFVEKVSANTVEVFSREVESG